MSHEKFGKAAEEALLEANAIRHRSLNRRQLLGCIGCRFAKAEAIGEEPGVYGLLISKCTNHKRYATYAALQQLETIDALTSEFVSGGSGGKPRRVYRPTDAPFGQILLENLEVPDVCPLDSAAPVHAPDEAPEP